MENLMDNNSIIQELQENGKMQLGFLYVGVKLSPMTVYYRTNFIGEVHYKIGTRLYIENAD